MEWNGSIITSTWNHKQNTATPNPKRATVALEMQIYEFHLRRAIARNKSHSVSLWPKNIDHISLWQMCLYECTLTWIHRHIHLISRRCNAKERFAEHFVAKEKKQQMKYGWLAFDMWSQVKQKLRRKAQRRAQQHNEIRNQTLNAYSLLQYLFLATQQENKYNVHIAYWCFCSNKK